MGEGLSNLLNAAPWASLALAFVVGLASGWLIWGLKGDDAGSRNAESAGSLLEGDDRKEIVVLRAELEAARALIEEGNGNDDDVNRQLSLLDETLKRANGRLKIVLRAIKK